MNDEIGTVCTTCGLQERHRVRATQVATAKNRMQWFECDAHGPLEHARAMGEEKDPGAVRVALEPLEQWRAKIRARDQEEE